MLIFMYVGQVNAHVRSGVVFRIKRCSNGLTMSDFDFKELW